MNQDVFEVACANRLFLYRYFWRLFAQEADEPLLEVVQMEQTRQEIELALGESAQACSAHASMVQIAQSSNEITSLLKSDYTKFFLMPGSLPAPPWESVYATGENLVFQQSTLEVRRAYASSGYIASGYPHEPDDHLATELNFIVMLIEETQQALSENDDIRAIERLQAQHLFLKDHLAKWIVQFADNMSRNAPKNVSAFYPQAAQLAASFCVADCEAIEGLYSLLGIQSPC